MLKTQLLELFPLGPEIPDHRRFDPLTAMAGISAGTSIVGGLFGSSAAKKAAAVQAQAARDAAGKVGQATGEANAGIADATRAGQDLVTAGGQRVLDTAGQANQLLDPFAATGRTATGELNTGLQAGGDFNKTPSLSDLQMDPGYAWRLQQGQLALERGAAARGGALGGAAAKDLTNYAQGAASQEYQSAFNRFETATQNRFNNLMTASNAGQAASGLQSSNLTNAANTALGANEYTANLGFQGQREIGGNLMQGAKTQGDFLTGGANAQAAGIVGGSNALWGGIQGAANTGLGAAMSNRYMNLMSNPATAPSSYAVNNLPQTSYTNPFLFGLPNNGGQQIP